MIEAWIIRYEINLLKWNTAVLLIFSLASLIAPSIAPSPLLILLLVANHFDIYTIGITSFSFILFMLVINKLVQATIGRRSRTFIVLVALTIVISPVLATFWVVGSISIYQIFIVSAPIIFFTAVVQRLVLSTTKTPDEQGDELDEHQYERIYRKLLRNKETLKVNIIQCMTIGPPTVGKTTLKEQLLANNEDDSVIEIVHDRPPSSPLFDKLKRIEVTISDYKNKQSPVTVALQSKYAWKELTFSEEVVGYLKKMSKKNCEVIADMSIWTYLISMVVVALYVFSAVVTMYDNPFKLIPLNYVYSIINGLFYLVIIIISFGILFAIILLAVDWIYRRWIKPNTRSFSPISFVREAIEKINVRTVPPLFDQTLTIYFRDCGGQPEFHEVLPALVSHSTLFLLVFNLSEGLDTRYKVTYKTNDGEVSDPYVSTFTVKQALLQCLASISSIGNYLNPPQKFFHKIKSILIWYREKLVQLWIMKVTLKFSKVIIIGTHKDLLDKTGEAEEKVQHINDQLELELKGTDWYTKDMVIPTENDRIFFGVNTFNPNDINKIKDLVHEVALNGSYQLDIPIPWLTFEFYIRKSQKKVMTLNECQELAKKSEISRADEFYAALWFFHNVVGIIRYFKNVPELYNIVITDSQLLFDIVTDLIVNTFNFKKGIRRRSEYDKFRSSGRFTKHHLEQCEAVKEKLLSVEQVIAVLEHLVIIAPVGINESNEQEYFLPCVLVHASLPSTPLLHNDSDIPPLLITFKCQYTPRGIFSSLIARILLDDKNKWELSTKEIYRDRVIFCILDSGHIVTITNYFRFLEVVVKPPRSKDEKTNDDIYLSVLNHISQCLSYITNKLNYSTTARHTFGFYCKEHDDISMLEHSAECNSNVKPKYTRCNFEGCLTANLTPQQQLWFYKESKEVISPEAKNPKFPQRFDITHLDIVTSYLRDKRFPNSSWKSLGLHLGLYQPTLDDIDTKNRGDPVKCLQDCLSAWLKEEDKVIEKGGANIDSLRNALKNI